jgi:ankyrin repeat protein
MFSQCYAVEMFPSAFAMGMLLWLTSRGSIPAGLSFFIPQFIPSAVAREADGSISRAEALNIAVRAERLDRVKQLVTTGADVNAKDRVGSAPLHVAALSGNVGIATFLLSHGADVNALQIETGSTPLDYAVLKGASAIVKLLLDAGARLDIRDHSGKTVLQVAAIKGNPQVLEVLLSAHPDVDAPDTKDQTALDEAVLHGRKNILAMLLAHGANPRRVHSIDGRGPLQEACVKGFA